MIERVTKNEERLEKLIDLVRELNKSLDNYKALKKDIIAVTIGSKIKIFLKKIMLVLKQEY